MQMDGDKKLKGQRTRDEKDQGSRCQAQDQPREDQGWGNQRARWIPPDKGGQTSDQRSYEFVCLGKSVQHQNDEV
jgi:hypothetical protein